MAGNAAWADGLRPFRGKVVGVLSASNGAMGGLRSQSHLVPLLFNLHCWVAPQGFALGRAADAFDDSGRLREAAARIRVQAVIDQVQWATERLHPAGSATSHPDS